MYLEQARPVEAATRPSARAFSPALTNLCSSPEVEQRVRTAVQRLQSLTRSASLQFAIEVGRVVVESLYAGDPTAWRGRAKKDHTLRTLAASPDLPISASALYRALSIYELNQATRGNIARARHLGISHVRAVLGLEHAQQLQLLESAERGGWTVCHLEREVARLRSTARSRGGRRPSPRYLKTIRQIHQLTSAECFDGLEEWSALSSSEVEELALKLAQARERLATVAGALTQNQTRTRSKVR